MPKTKKEKKSSALRHKPIEKVIEATEYSSKFVVEKPWKKKKEEIEDESQEASNSYVDSKLTRKILDQARSQREEVHKEVRPKGAAAVPSKMEDSSQSEDEFEIQNALDFSDDEDQEELVRIEGDYVGDVGLSQAEEQMVESFMATAPSERRTLADIIMSKIKEKEANNVMGNTDDSASPSLPPKVVQVYTGVGKLLSRYRSGKVPKAFKIIPALTNWEEILWLTRPDEWTPQATYQATRLMASNCDPKCAELFYRDFLLEKVRDDIRENKKLNYHLYASLKKALYKPAAFYKGILLPLALGGDCTLHEATIVGSVLTKVSIPVNHSAVALLKLAEGRYSGASSMFIKLLLNKKYCLPYRVIDALVEHFLAFVNEDRELPVLWHQSLLVFVQRYKYHITKEQKECMKPLVKKHFHHQMTSEIRRELFNSRSRGEPEEQRENNTMMES